MGIDLSTSRKLALPDYPGAEVTMSLAASLREFREMLQMRDGATIDQLDAVMGQFGDRFLLSWEVEMHGKPVPATGEGLATLPLAFQLAVLTEWLAVVSERMSVPAPLVAASTNGSPSAAESVTTEAL